MAITVDRDLVRALNELITMDRAAAGCYGAAAEQIDDPKIVRTLQSFQEDHERHALDLTDLVRRMGGVIEWKQAIQDRMPHTADEVRNLGDVARMMQAMHDTEELTNEMYARCAALGVGDAKLQKTLERNLADERRHLAWVEQQLQGSGLEQVGVRPTGRQAGRQQRAQGSQRQGAERPQRGQGGVAAGTLDLNRASVDEIARLEGIGRRRAEQLVGARPFRTWDDVRAVDGIGEGLVEKLRRACSIG